MIAPFITGGMIQWAETRHANHFEAAVLSYSEDYAPYVVIRCEPLYPSQEPKKCVN